VDGTSVGKAGFGQASDYATVPSGKADLSVSLGGKPLLDATHVLRDGRRYSVIAMASSPPKLRVYADDEAAPGVARMRVIHAAPELGKPDLTVDGKVVGERVPFETATRYWGLPPGDHTLEVTNPASGKPVIAPTQVPLAAGTASTVLVVGSGGEKVRSVLVTDSDAAPSAAPATGLGGLAPHDGPNWPLAAIAALVTGIAALGVFRVLIARGRLFRV
jgi:hypothetical protein